MPAGFSTTSTRPMPDSPEQRAEESQVPNAANCTPVTDLDQNALQLVSKPLSVLS
jgi:hypothetical protein